MTNIFTSAIVVVTINSFVTSYPIHKLGDSNRRRVHHIDEHERRSSDSNGEDPQQNVLPPFELINLSKKHGLPAFRAKLQHKKAEVSDSGTEQSIASMRDNLLDSRFPSSQPLSPWDIMINAARESTYPGVKEGTISVPLKSNTTEQVDDSREVINQYKAQQAREIPKGVLPPITNHKEIVTLTGEEDGGVMERFGSSFHDFNEIQPSDDDKTRDGRGSKRSRRTAGSDVHVCAQNRVWQDVILAISANDSLVQVYQSQRLRQFVLSSRSTERQSSVVPNVTCVNETSTVNAVVVNVDTNDIQQTVINVETCRAKFDT